jgi:hypothetical protein
VDVADLDGVSPAGPVGRLVSGLQSPVHGAGFERPRQTRKRFPLWPRSYRGP